MKASNSGGHYFLTISIRGAPLSSRGNLHSLTGTRYPCFREGCCAFWLLRTCTICSPQFLIKQNLNNKNQQLFQTQQAVRLLQNSASRAADILLTIDDKIMKSVIKLQRSDRYMEQIIICECLILMLDQFGVLVYKIIIEMSRGLFSALSALTVVAGTAVYYLWKKVGQSETELVDRLLIKDTLITLRKRAYSTLREIAFIVNHIRTLEGDLEVRKISDIFMRDGGSGEKKLQAIEALVLEDLNITRAQFQYSCNYYCQNDIQIKLLLEMFKKDLNMALEGVLETYHGPLPRFSPDKVLRIEEQIIKRRMQIICRKYIEKVSNEECLKLQSQIQEYLREEGIFHQKQPNQKLFMSMLEHYYRDDSHFKNQFERLEMEMEMFMIEIENKYINQEPPKVEKQKIEQRNPEKMIGDIKERRPREIREEQEIQHDNRAILMGKKTQNK